jgi:hypothetical protein
MLVASAGDRGLRVRFGQSRNIVALISSHFSSPLGIGQDGLGRAFGSHVARNPMPRWD